MKNKLINILAVLSIIIWIIGALMLESDYMWLAIIFCLIGSALFTPFLIRENRHC